MMNTILLSEIIEQTKNLMLSKGYSKHTIATYSKVWKQYNKYCLQKNIVKYTKNLRKEFLIEHYNFNFNSDFTKYQKNIIKALDILDNMSNGFPIHYKSLSKESIPLINADVYNHYIQYLEETLKLSKATIKIKKYAICKFLRYINNIRLIDVKSDKVYSFINTLDSYSLTNKSLITENIKLFFTLDIKMTLLVLMEMNCFR